jgi:hypothetical protein
MRTREVKRPAEGDNAVWVYRKNLLPAAIRVGVISVVSVFIFWIASPYLAVLLALTMAFFLDLPFALEFRRAIVISTEYFEYRWPTGGPVRIRISEIGRIEETSTSYMLGVRAVFAPGVRLILKSGEAQTFPVDLPDQGEILARLRAMVGNDASAPGPST